MICSGCGADVPDEDLFCEICGHRLGPVPEATPACACGAPLNEADEDGFCQRCGRRVRRPASDHVEEALSPNFAAVSDRGLQHDRNEDRFALVATERGLGVAVCDGVSSTHHAEHAAGLVAASIAETLRAALGDGEPLLPETTLRDAIAKAGEALQKQGQLDSGRWEAAAPSTTVVAALRIGDEITVAWVGDSRAYWMGEDGVATALTEDHSWRNAVLREGQMSAEEADRSPEAHAILRWVGPDADAALGPEVVKHTATMPGALLLCTDGLWNYAPTPEQLSRVFAEAAAGSGTDALATVQHLVAFALAAGGRDNITAALLRVAPETAHTDLPVEPHDDSLRTGREEEP